MPRVRPGQRRALRHLGRPVRAGASSRQEAGGLRLSLDAITARRPVDHARVTAVLVARNGARWLPRTLAALAAQTRPPDRVVAVDTDSDDDSAQIMATHVGQVVRTAPTTSLLDAVRAGLTAWDAERLSPREDPHEPVGAVQDGDQSGGEPSGREWVWLVHDDSAPAPDVLERLLAAVEVAPSVGVAGCKQRTWDGTGRLVQTGFTVSRFGRVITGVEAGDVDQGQTDTREDVLAVGSAGMLVRRDVWDSLGGGDPATPLVGDDLDLCLRARAAGHRVIVVPAAVVAHADASRTHQRRSPLLDRGVWWTRRRQVAHRRLVDAPLPLLPLVVLSVLVGGLGRLVARTAAKEPRRALGELTAVLAALARPDLVWRARRRLAHVRVVPRSSLAELRAGSADLVRWHRDRWQRWRQQRRAVLVPTEGRSRTAGGWKVPALVSLVLAGVSVAALHRLAGPGPVSGGALAPAPGDLGRLWDSARATWSQTGLGSGGPPDPFLSTLTALSLPFWTPSLAVPVLLLAALPLAGLGAWAASGAATRSAWLRGWAAVTWAAAPPLLAGLDEGRLGPVVAHVVLPWVVLAVARTVTAVTVRRAWTAAAAGGLAFAVAATAAPVLLPVGLLALGLMALVAARRAGARVLALGWTALPALVLSGPWLAAAVEQPRLLVTDPGLLLPSGAPPAWRYLLGQPAETHPWHLPAQGWTAGVPVAVADAVGAGLAAVLVLLAVLALLRSGPRARAVRAGWLLAALGVVAAVVAGRVVVGTDVIGTVTGWSGTGTSLVVAGLLVAVLTGADGLRRRLGRRRRAWRPVVAAVLAATALVAPLVGLGSWTWRHAEGAGELRRGEVAALPAVAHDAATSPDRTSTLVLDARVGLVNAAVTRTRTERLDTVWSVHAARNVVGPLGQGAVPAEPDAAQAAVNAAVAALASGSEEAQTALTDLGVGYVLLLGRFEGEVPDEPAGPPDDVPASSTIPITPSVLDSVQGLARSGEISSGVLWRVTPAAGGGADAVDRAARARLLDADGAPLAVLPSGRVDVRTRVPAGEAGRRVVLAERSDPGWSAYLDHRRLEPAVHAGWAQAFELGEEGGRLVVEHEVPGRDVWDVVQVVVLALTVLLAVPVGGGTRKVRTR